MTHIGSRTNLVLNIARMSDNGLRRDHEPTNGQALWLLFRCAGVTLLVIAVVAWVVAR